MRLTAEAKRAPVDRFGHEAMLYRSHEGFLEGVAPFLREGIEQEAAVLVAVDPAKIALLTERLGLDADAVEFVDMPALGRNPGRIIPVWREFVAQNAGQRPMRGVGEPVWPGRGSAEMVECHLHESLLNRAFDDGPAWRLMCPYDVEALEPEVVREARRTHPFVREAGVVSASERYEASAAVEVFDDALPDPPGQPPALAFDMRTLGDVRRIASEQAARAGVNADRVFDLVLAVNEVATNSLVHGGGEGTLRFWLDGRTFVCEILDAGVIDEPLVGRTIPTPRQVAGRGLWMANQLCDLVQLRSSPAGVAVRLHVSVD